jgi:YcxB-like protein
MNEITYTVEVSDMKAFQRYHRRTSPIHRRLRIFLLLLFVGFSLDLALREEGASVGYRILYFFVMLGIFMIFGTAITFVANQIAQFRAYRDGERHGILGEHTITLTPDALHERTAVNDTKAAWRGIFRVAATPQHIFIFTQPNAAHVIPRRSFASPSDSEQFLTTARMYHEAARQSA